MNTIVSSLSAEYRKYKRLAEIALLQLHDDELYARPAEGSNSPASLVWHLSGNLKSRFTDFLTTDGEKPWRNKQEEFSPPRVSREQMLARWEDGWQALFECLESLSETDLSRTVVIAGEPHSVNRALLRMLAHTSYHVGQLVFIGKSRRGAGWKPSKSFE